MVAQGNVPATDVEWTADLPDAGVEQTADLPGENIADRTPTREELPLAGMPNQHAVGFFAFAACTLIATLLSPEEPAGSSHAPTKIALAGGPLANAATAPEPDRVEKPAATRPTQSVESKPKNSRAGSARGVVAFDSRAFATSERSVAAVFIVRRTQDVRGAAAVHWAARSGSADAGIDFSDASGTVRFADGQRQRAIYVPLRNDLLTEEDETFKVCLRSPRQARIGGGSCAEVTIRDDDGISRT